MSSSLLQLRSLDFPLFWFMTRSRFDEETTNLILYGSRLIADAEINVLKYIQISTILLFLPHHTKTERLTIFKTS